MFDPVPSRTGWVLAVAIAAACQDTGRPAHSAQQGERAANDQKATVALGEAATELDKAILYVFQAKDDTYWFGSNEQGVYRYDGTTITHFTTRDGLASDQIRGIQEDKAGNIYFTTYNGISKYDGNAFATLDVSADDPAGGWKLQPDDLWFVGPQDTGVVFRYDGTSLHRLAFPRTKRGDQESLRFPRSEYPNAIYSPYDVYTIYRDRGGAVWFGTASLVACRYDGVSFDWLYEDHLTNPPEGGSFGIRSILEDKTGAFWICNTRYRFRINPGDVPDPGIGLIEYRREAGIGGLQTPGGADHIYFMSIVEDDGALWMAGDGVWRHDGHKVTHYPVKDGARQVTVFSINKDNRGDLWLGTHDSGAYKFNGSTFEKFRP